LETPIFKSKDSSFEKPNKMSMQISVEKLFFQVCCVYEKLGLLDLIFMQVGFHELYPFVQRGKSVFLFFHLANKNSTDSPCSNKAVKK